MMVEKIFAAIDIFSKYVGKTVLLILYGLFALVALTLIHFMWFWVITSWVKPEWHGSYNLGAGIYMIDWDAKTKELVEGTQFEGRTCMAGNLIIPSDARGYLSDSVYSIVGTEYDERWIIAKAASRKQSEHYYFIIDKSFKTDSVPISDIYGTYLVGYTDSLEFVTACKNKKIAIVLEK